MERVQVAAAVAVSTVQCTENAISKYDQNKYRGGYITAPHKKYNVSIY